MIKLIIFDFDGTLASCRDLHYESLNAALSRVGPEFIISKDEHISVYDGLSTRKKLSMLKEKKNFPHNKIEQVYIDKQYLTITMMDDYLSYDERLVKLFAKLKSEGFLIYMASNAIRKTLDVGLEKLGLINFFDKIYSNEDVTQQKPHPQIYLKAMADAGVKPSEAVIVEDSKHGRESAFQSGAFVCGVDNPADLTYAKLQKFLISKTKQTPWCGKDVTVLIPMSGLGSRFSADKNYKLPKPLIDVAGKPMIQRVVENLNIDANFVFVVQKLHYEMYNLQIILPLIAPGCKIVQVDGVTAGAACSTLLAKEYIDNDQHLLIANSDQLVDWDVCDFMHTMLSNDVDGGILTFQDVIKNPKWSFAKTDSLGVVTEVAEKNPISDLATVGIYFFNRGSEYVKFAEDMIKKEIKHAGEYYVCPIYNEYIAAGKKIKTYNCEKMNGIGTPDDLKLFLNTYTFEN